MPCLRIIKPARLRLIPDLGWPLGVAIMECAICSQPCCGHRANPMRSFQNQGEVIFQVSSQDRFVVGDAVAKLSNSVQSLVCGFTP
jgi:hypothetical protein